MTSIIKVNTIQDVDGNNIINENANTITIGKSGDTVTVASGATLTGAGIEWQSSIVTAATLTAEAGKGYWIDTSSNACTVTLPTSSSVGDELYFVDFARNFGTNALTLDQGSQKYQGNTSPNPVYNLNGQAVAIVYSGSTKGWIPTTDDVSSFKTGAYSADFLVIAGAGGGGAGAVGKDTGTGGTDGDGGDGVVSTISGSSVTRGGGGGAGNYNSGNVSIGGAGGGGAGGSGAPAYPGGVAGTANTGGGGGGSAGLPNSGGNGGSGVVILRVPTSNYSSTTTGSPTVTTSGSDTILTFNASGSYTG